MAQGVSDPGWEELAAENRALRKEVSDLKSRVAELEQALQETLVGLERMLLREIEIAND